MTSHRSTSERRGASQLTTLMKTQSWLRIGAILADRSSPALVQKRGAEDRPNLWSDPRCRQRHCHGCSIALQFRGAS